MGGEGRWVAVIAVDAFYIYAIDLYTPNAVVWMPTREFTRFWWELDGDGHRQTGVAMLCAAPNTTSPPSGPTAVQLKQLLLESAPDEHPAVEIASL